MYEKMKKQWSVKENDRIFPVDIAIEITAKAKEQFVPWMLKNIPRIDINGVTVDQDLSNNLYAVTYRGKKYLLETITFDSSEISSALRKVVILNSIDDSFFPKVELCAISKGLPNTFEARYDHLLIFYEYHGDLKAPLYLNDRQMSSFMYLLHTLLTKNLYMSNFVVYTFGEQVWLKIDEIFVIDDDRYGYDVSISYLQNKYYTLVGQELPLITSGFAKDLYLEEMGNYYEKMLSDESIKELYECFAAKL